MLQRLGRSSRARFIATLTVLLLLAAGGSAQASYLDDLTQLSLTVSVLRGAIGDHPRVLKVEIDADTVTMQAQDPHNRNHVDEWRYGKMMLAGIIPVRRLTGPEPVDPTLINPDLEANLFDLDAVDFSALPKLVAAAIDRARLQDAAAVTRIEIARQVYILPSPTSGDVRWALHISSGREQAEVYANAQGTIIGSDLSGTQRARTLNILKETDLVPQAAAAFRAAVGAGAVLTKVGIEAKTVGFGTNIRDQSLGKLISGMPSTETFTWDLDGLQQRLGAIDVNAQMGTPGPAPFSVDDADWTILGKLETDALAKDAIPQASIKRIELEKSSENPGSPILVWTVEITEPSGETTSVIADAKGLIQRVVLPESRRPKVVWLDPGTLAKSVARVSSIFGTNAKVASIVFDDRGGRVTVDDPANSNHASTFEFSGDGVTRAAISFSLESMGPRFSVSDLAGLTEQKFAALEATAMKMLGAQKTVYLESVSIGAHPFVRKAGARAIEVRVRDIPEDSVRAAYGWIVFDFEGRVLDYVTPN
jgi:hypothetical protein